MKYNYIVLGNENEYYTLGYSDLDKYNDAVYIDSPSYAKGICGKIIGFLRKVHTSEKVNSIVKLPGKSVWNKHLINYKFNNDKPVCFIFFCGCTFSDQIPYGLIDFLKKNYINARFVVFYQDLVCHKRKIDLMTYKKYMDLVISFDIEDSKENNLLYHPLVYSDIADTIVPYEYESDIYFCGAAKNRLKEIIEAYVFFTNAGFKCDFNVIIPHNQDYPDYMGIKFYRSFPYTENLRHLKASKYILEIMQKGGTGYTIRTCEAIAFNKKLISNNLYLQSAFFYDKNNIITYDSLQNIDVEILRSASKCTNNRYMHDILPYEFLKFIDKRF